MRYALMRKMDISNGDGIGASLFVQGCHFHCKNCFNSSTWDFSGGKEWNNSTLEQFMSIISPDYITRVTILGGEPLDDENVGDVYEIVSEIRKRYPDKKIWIYTGYRFDEIIVDNLLEYSLTSPNNQYMLARCLTVLMADVVVDGQYVDELRNIRLKWRGSSNQRLIDVKKTYHNYNEQLGSGNICLIGKYESLLDTVNSSVVNYCGI